MPTFRPIIPKGMAPFLSEATVYPGARPGEHHCLPREEALRGNASAMRRSENFRMNSRGRPGEPPIPRIAIRGLRMRALPFVFTLTASSLIDSVEQSEPTVLP